MRNREDIDDLIRAECADQHQAREDAVLSELSELSKLNGGNQ